VNPAAQKPSASVLAQLFEPVRDDLREVEREFSRHVQSQIAIIPAIGNYVKDSGGKRIRPAVLLMAARMAGYTGERAVLYASVVEFIHTATLVHDDIIDEAELRRGREAAHTRWGNHLTVLFGDFLYLKSMSLALTQDSLDIIRLLCDVTLRIVEGEIYQLTKTGVVDLTEEEHFDIVRRKTAYLFAGCAKIGGMLGPITREQQDALWEYGFNIGMAFQIVDDLLDFTGEEVALGKPVGGDLREGKMTLPVIHLLARGDAAAETLIRKVMRDRDVTLDEWREIRGMLTKSRSIDYAYSTAVEFVESAKKALQVFPPSPAREALMFLPDYVLSRDR
jgi:octaprenyl-diphosphate synthase